MNKIFLPVWKSGKDLGVFGWLPSNNELFNIINKSEFSKINYYSDEEFVEQVNKLNIPDISQMVLWDETEKYKIYIYKFIDEDNKNMIKLFFHQVDKNNIHNKQIIFINPTETVSHTINNVKNPNYLCVYSNEWCGIGTQLYAKSMYDGLAGKNWDKILRIANKKFKPFKLSLLVRRGHDRRYEFFKYLHQLNNPEFLITYFNAGLTAKGMQNEIDGINFNEKDGIEFPYCSHEAIQPVWFHASFSGEEFMLQAISLMAMSKFNLVVESCDHSGGALTEKSLFPFLTKTIPILVNGREHIDWLERLGFHTFVDELGIVPTKELEYFTGSDNTKYFQYHFNLIDKINRGELDNFYEENIDKIEHNFKIALELQSGNFLY